jgi:alpha-beta hydrolase superfamily lysophospholipase
MKDDHLTGFVQETLALNDDYDGHAYAALVSNKVKLKTNKAVLYIHGFADYYFNTQLADAWVAAGYNFYALDLRKYGRALMAHQHPNFCKDLGEYFEEIDKAVSIIRNRDGHTILVLNGHSTGGLTASLYTHERRCENTIDALILNSPWFDINESWLVKKIALKFVFAIGKFFPTFVAPKGLDPNYARSVHKNYNVKEKKEIGVYEEGLWNFNTDWKSVGGFPVYAGFLRAVRNGQKKLQRGLDIKCPVLLLCTDKQGKRTKVMEPHYFNSDCVLDPKHMLKYLSAIGASTKQIVIKDGLHDLALSSKPVRENYFKQITQWLSVAISA